LFCTENLKGRNIDPDVDGKDAETDIKNVHSMRVAIQKLKIKIYIEL